MYVCGSVTRTQEKGVGYLNGGAYMWVTYDTRAKGGYQRRSLHVYVGHLEHKSKHGAWRSGKGGSLRGEKLT